MGGILKFFLNAIKAIFIGPFYIVYFCFYLIYCLINHLIGEVRVLFSGFKYASKNENIYHKKVQYKIKMIQKGGDQ